MGSEPYERVDRDPVPLLCVREQGDPADVPKVAGRAWERLETRLPTLRGRQFYGLFFPQRGEYLACMAAREEDDANALGLEQETLPGGLYLRMRLRGEPEELYLRIGPSFDRLSQTGEPDHSRPSVEFYRRRDEVDLLFPIAR